MTRSIIISSHAIEDLMMIAPESCVGRHRVRSLSELHAVLDTLEPVEHAQRLDLVGHSTRDTRLLRIGKTVVDMTDARVERFFERLGAEQLPRLRVTTIRLLGCETAVDIAGQRTMHRLAKVAGVKVYGARKPLLKQHYNAAGFDPAFARTLIESSELPDPPRPLRPT